MPSFAVTESSEIAQARRAVTALAGLSGFDQEDAGRAALVATEICSNIVKHGGGGELLAQRLERGEQRGLELIGLDRGSGMTDVAKCLKDGFSTSGSPGTGLGAIRRQAQHFDVYSRHEQGTVVLAQLWPAGSTQGPAALEQGVIVVPKAGETECGDAWCHLERSGVVLIMGVDGLGHGLGAAQAAAAACTSFMEAKGSPATVLQRVHMALRTTRGAAIVVLEIDWQRQQLLASGIGNMVAAIVTGEAVKRIASDNGIVGHATPRIRELRYELAPHAAVIVHSDGLTTNWQPARYPGLMQHHCALIAAVLYRDCKRGSDDSLVVVIKRVAT